MSGLHQPPPEVPDEFAEAYRVAYEAAMREAATAHRVGSDPERPHPDPAEPAPGDLLGAIRAAAARWREDRWVLPVLAAVGAVVLVLAAYLLGRAVAGDPPPVAGSPTHADGRVLYVGDSSTQPPGRVAETNGSPWRGEVTPVDVRHVRSTCTARPGVDSGGDPVDYRAANVLDDDAETAWRCRGAAQGQRLVFRLRGPTALGEIGLVPGYAKTDPVSGADRYAQNNRITKVRWTIGEVSVEQTLSGDPGDRSVQLLRIPRTTASRVTLEVLAVDRGPRNTTAISEVRLAAAAP